MTDVTVGLTLKATDSGFVGTVRVSKDEVEKLNEASEKLAKGAGKASDSVGKFGRESDRAAGKTRRQKRETDGLSRAMEQSRRVANRWRLALIAVATAATIAFASGSTKAAIGLDRIENGLVQAIGSSEGARREFQFVREEADRLGLDLEAAARSYTKLAAATRGSNIEGETTRQIFLGIAESGTVLGFSADELAGSIRALEQIVSKGNVSAEELRGQLGERLQGAFQIAARSIGVTTQELNKMLEGGKLTAEQLLPALARELRLTFGPNVARAAKSTQAEINRFNTAMFELRSEFARSGFIDGFLEGIGALSAIMQEPGFRQSMREFGAFVGATLTFMAQHAREIVAAGAGLSAFLLTLRLFEGKKSLPTAAIAGLLTAIGTYVATAGDAETQTDNLAESFAKVMDLGVPLAIATGSNAEAAKKHAAAVKEIRDALIEMLPPFEAGVERANIWRREILADLDQTKDGYDDLAASVDRVFNKMIADAYDESLEQSRKWSDGAKRALRDYADAATDAARNTAGAIDATMTGLEDVLVRADDAVEVLQGIAEDIQRILIRQFITGPLAGLFTNFASGLFPAAGAGSAPGTDLVATVGVAHRGGVVGRDRFPRRNVDPRAFAGAPRFHQGGVAGLRPNEVPIIAEAGERIIPAGAGGAAPVVNVNIINSSGEPVQTRRSRNGFGQEEIEVLIGEAAAKDVANNGPLGQAIGNFTTAERRGASL